MTNAKKFCTDNRPVAFYTLMTDECLRLYGIVHGIDDYAYISDTYGTHTTYHKLKIRYCNEKPYVMFGNMRVYIDEFIKI